MNYQTTEEIRRFRFAMDKLKRNLSSKILSSKKNTIDPIFSKEILNGNGKASSEIVKEIKEFEGSNLMKSDFGKTYFKGWVKRPVRSIWRRFRRNTNESND